MFISGTIILIPLGNLGLISRTKYDNLLSNEVYAVTIVDIMSSNLLNYIIGSILMASSVAAIMSTADSMLIATSQLMTEDIISLFINTENDELLVGDRNKKQNKIIIIGRICTFIFAALAIPFSAYKINLS